MEEKEKIEIRQHDIEAILGKSPSWLVKWGTTVMAFVILSLLAVSYFFSYPEVVSVPVVITPEKPPLQITVPENMDLKEVFVKENDSVSRGMDLLLGITNTGEEVRVKSPDAGKVMFSAILVPGDRLVAGENILSVVFPSHKDYIGVVKVLAADMAKIRIGQTAQVKLDMYPYMQYGVLKGTVARITQLPSGGYYSVMIRLPGKTVSNYGQNLVLQPEMTGTVSIITQNMSLFERLIAPVRAVIR